MPLQPPYLPSLIACCLEEVEVEEEEKVTSASGETSTGETSSREEAAVAKVLFIL